MHWWNGDWHMGWGLMGLSWLMWIALIVAVIWAVTRVGSRRDERGHPGVGPQAGPPSGSAEEILRQRYARGEIDRDEFRQRMQDLREH